MQVANVIMELAVKVRNIAGGRYESVEGQTQAVAGRICGGVRAEDVAQLLQDYGLLTQVPSKPGPRKAPTSRDSPLSPIPRAMHATMLNRRCKRALLLSPARQGLLGTGEPGMPQLPLVTSDSSGYATQASSNPRTTAPWPWS